MKILSRSNDKKNLELNFNRIMEYVKRYVPGTLFEVSVTRKLDINKSPLRKYYWAVVMPLFLEAHGYDPDEAELVHNHLKILFFGVQPDSHGIYREKDIPPLFAEESDEENKVKLKFIEWCRRKAAEQGVYIPEPNETPIEAYFI